MKELSLEEISLLEEMKSNCLKKGQYIDDKAKDKFKMLCHLEDFSIAYYELLDVIKEVRERVLNENKPLPSAREIIEILDKVSNNE